MDNMKNTLHFARTSTDVEKLEQLSKNTNDNVRYYIAQNPSTSKETLEQLSKDSANANLRMILCKIKQNENTSMRVKSKTILFIMMKVIYNDVYTKE